MVTKIERSEEYREEHRQRCKEYYWKHRKQNNDACKRWLETHRKEKVAYRQLHLKRLKERYHKLAPACVVCGKTHETIRIALHEVSCKPHEYCNYYFYFNHPEKLGFNFIPVCFFHHKMVHYLVNYFKLDATSQHKIMEIVQQGLPKDVIMTKT